MPTGTRDGTHHSLARLNSVGGGSLSRGVPFELALRAALRHELGLGDRLDLLGALRLAFDSTGRLRRRGEHREEQQEAAQRLEDRS